MEMHVGWVTSQAVFSVRYYFENFIVEDCSLFIQFISFFAFSVYKHFSVVSICVPYFTKTHNFHHINHLSKSMAILQEMLGKFSIGIVISKCSLYLISK